jgi:hypothetical protein
MLKFKLFLCLVLGFVLTQGSVQAQLVLDITPATQNGNIGSILSFSATLTNVSLTDTIDLVGSSGNFSGLGNLVAWDDTDFLNGLPLSLAPDTFYTENLFAVIDPTAAPAAYTGIYTVEGSDPLSNPVLASDNVSVTVQSSSSAVPEPGSMAFAASIVGTLGWLLHRRRIRK